MLSSLASRLLLACVAVVPTALAKPEQIRAVSSPIFHYYLQAYPQDPTIPVMGPESSSEYFDIGTSIKSTNTSKFLNIGSDSTSYKTLTFAEASATDAWALEGDTIITSTGSSFGRQLNFLVCQLSGSYWQVYLQTGSDTPSGKTCSNYQSLHLPCLC
ncbi:uncharacterized protein F4822DRAFT_263974 [Hypoxylon trugodes]|uniref:uncharacterized protein n=1 Tax=Hypoxylon trugodes TaxID=326681 RepID=UPI002190B48B|nr:uncharacterized protein F4822DRAFT_263974 [Hypoxylon trugodes]KAI1388969.1 hypothetical protein F4822DRAFT_263974 [Hypoxylon trugodes]